MSQNIQIRQLQTFRDAPLNRDIREMLNRAAYVYGDRTAFRIKTRMATKKTEAEYRDVSFTQVRDDVNALGTALVDMGLKGKTIAIIGENSYDWFVAYLTTVCGLGICVPLDKGLPITELKNSIERSHADVLLFDKKHQALAEQLRSEGSEVEHFFCLNNSGEYPCIWDFAPRGQELLAEGNRDYLDIEIDPNAMQLIIFTSGTTSAPKGVMLSHRNITYNLYAMRRCEEILEGDINIAFLPYHHTFGATGQLMMIDCGVTTVFCDGLKYVQKNLVEYGVSVFVGVPLIAEQIYKKIMLGIKKQGKEKQFSKGLKISGLLRKIGIDKRRSLFKDIHEQLGGKLRLVVTGASALDPGVAKGFSAIGIEVVQGYGMTEASPVIAAENLTTREPNTIGKAMYGIMVEIDNPDSEGVGEIITKSPSVMLGYYNNPEETAKVIRNGWLHTGDLAYVTKKGNLTICGRSKNVIVLKNGKNVYPEEIEVVVSKLPYIKENIVFSEVKLGGTDDRDQVIVLKLVYDPEYFKSIYNTEDEEEIRKIVQADIDKINDEMPAYKRISRVIIQDNEMIKTTTGKVKRYEEGAK